MWRREINCFRRAAIRPIRRICAHNRVHRFTVSCDPSWTIRYGSKCRVAGLIYRNGMEPDISSVAALISEPARGRILLALLDGRSLPATELAQRAGITCQTTSSHLAKLTEGGLLRVIPQGRHRYCRIENARIAELLESMARFVPRKETDSSKPKSPIQIARTCYNHLAGRLGVRITEAIVGRGTIARSGSRLSTHQERSPMVFRVGNRYWCPTKIRSRFCAAVPRLERRAQSSRRCAWFSAG